VKRALPIAVAAFLVLLFATCTWRAATQSITHDEALTWQIYLAGPLAPVFDYYDANHHFLSTLLERFSTAVFGVSEFSLRAPTLVAAALYFATAYRLCLLIFGTGPLFALAVLLLTANPLVLDFFVAARGYGLALACFFYALLQMREVRGTPARRLALAGTALALSVAANLTFLVPAFVLGVLFAWSSVRTATPAPQKKRTAGAGPVSLKYFVWPAAAVVLLLFLLAPISTARVADFYAGTDSPLASARNLVECSLAHNPGLSGINDLAAIAAWRRILTLALPALLLAAAVFGLLRGTRDSLLFLAGGTIACSAVVLVAMHYALGVPFPIDRTGIYFLPLAGLVLADSARLLLQAAPRRLAGITVCALGALLAAQYVLQWNTASFLVWRYGADSKQIVERIARERTPGSLVRVGISWQLEPAFNFYRTVRRWTWLGPFDRQSPDGAYDYYVLIANDHALIAARSLRTLYRGPVSQTILARP
jgi:hypothetical protein